MASPLFPIFLKSINQTLEKVARERFELSSAGPKPAMLDHYTTGLQHGNMLTPSIIFCSSSLSYPRSNKHSHAHHASEGNNLFQFASQKNKEEK